MTNIFFEIHSGLPREGPGDDASTVRALAFAKGLPPKPDILDVGCGPGAQTLVLARATGGLVTAVDNHAPFLADLRRRAELAGLAGDIQSVLGSMFELPFEEASFDLIWSEGAIYIMGFDQGLVGWRRFLRPNGWLGVSEVAWLRKDPPSELADFWNAGYPAIRTIDKNLAAIRYSNYDFFVGAYPNDQPTVDAVLQAAARFPKVHLALCPHAGPTSKGDCLNWIYQHMLAFERGRSNQRIDGAHWLPLAF